MTYDSDIIVRYLRASSFRTAATRRLFLDLTYITMFTLQQSMLDEGQYYVSHEFTICLKASNLMESPRSLQSLDIDL